MNSCCLAKKRFTCCPIAIFVWYEWWWNDNSMENSCQLSWHYMINILVNFVSALICGTVLQFLYNWPWSFLHPDRLTCSVALLNIKWKKVSYFVPFASFFMFCLSKWQLRLIIIFISKVQALPMGVTHSCTIVHEHVPGHGHTHPHPHTARLAVCHIG